MSAENLVRMAVVVAGAVLLSALQGCGAGADDAGEVHATPTVGSVAHDHKDLAATARPYIGKPRPPVRVQLEQQSALEVGVPAELQLKIRSGVPLSGLELLLEGDTGLEVTGLQRLEPVSTGAQVAAASFEDGTDASYRILVTPTSGGESSVSGQVRFWIGGVEQAAPFRLEVPVNGPARAASGMPDAAIHEPFMDDAGELIVSMPAETIANGR